MKTFRIIGFALFAILLGMSACSGGDDPIEPTPKPEVVVPEITIDSSVITSGLSFTNEKGEQSISFTTNDNWTLSIAETRSGVTWCTASATSGSKGNNTVKFTVTENTTYDDRSVAVTLKSGSVSKTFSIAQKGVDALLVTTDKYEINKEGGSIEIEVKSNINYKMEISETAKSWITESSSRGLTSYKHTLNISANEDPIKREGEIYFKSGDKTETVKIYQMAGEAVLLLSQNECHISDEGATININVKSNVDFGVQMPEVDWITDENSSRGLSSHTLKYIISANDTYDNRSAEIVFYDKNSNLKETLKITQVQKDAIVISKKEYDVNPEGETIEIELSSNVDFEISIEDNWVTKVESKSSRGLVSHKLYFQVSENNTEKERNTKINITDKNKQISDAIVFKQNILVEEIPYLTFSADDKQTLTMSKAVETLEYSLNGGEWMELGTNTVEFGGEYGDLQIRGMNFLGTANTYMDCSTIVFGNSIPVSCTGDIRTLVNYKDYKNADTSEARFCSLFENCTNLISAPELPATILANWCYEFMFSKCTSLKTAPELPAVNLAEGCYRFMFDGCTALTTPPELPATNLVDLCYKSMFSGCTSLTSFSILPATKLAYNCYNAMFWGCTSLTEAPILPALKLAQDCYSVMFSDCTSLVTAPELPATELADGCYGFMFSGCTNLKSAPKLPAMEMVASGCYAAMFEKCVKLEIPPVLPATTLSENCYHKMFSGCISLKSVPELPATNLSKGCYNLMFKDCVSIITAPTLPATNLSDFCYSYMFSGCTSLTVAPKLPATKLANRCYDSMFEYCSGLTTPPELPATKLENYCYVGMFADCTNLTSAPVLPATELSDGCYGVMFCGCTKLTSAPALPATELSTSCYYYMFSDCTSLTEAPELPAKILKENSYQYMFNNCNKLNSITMLATDVSGINCMTNWVKGVSSVGTFTKSEEMESLTIGNNGIPTGWAVKNYGE